MEHFRISEVIACPPESVGIYWWLTYPSTVVSLTTAAVLALVLALVTFLRYNHVLVYNVKVRRPAISNGMWVMYFLALGLALASEAPRYALELPTWLDITLVSSSLFFFAVAQAILALALAHQREHRSAVPPRAPSEGSALLAPLPSSPPAMSRLSLVLVGACVLSLGASATLLASETSWSWFLWLTIWGVQRLPTVILAALIVTGPSHMQSSTNAQSNPADSEGPRPLAKSGLLLALVLLLVADLPLPLWTTILPPQCTFYIASALDSSIFSRMIGMIFAFLFLRAEFQRNKEETVWRIVSERTDYFDFRDF